MLHHALCYCILMLFQVINVYNQEYESAAAFWPDVHGRIIMALVISQVLLMGLLTTKQAAQSTPFLIVLPILTIYFHWFCKGLYEPAFVRYPLEVCQVLALQYISLVLSLCLRIITRKRLSLAPYSLPLFPRLGFKCEFCP